MTMEPHVVLLLMINSLGPIVTKFFLVYQVQLRYLKSSRNKTILNIYLLHNPVLNR